jgi:two-component system response regulator AtoC
VETNLGLQSIVETHDEPFLIVDRAFRVVAANSAFQQVYRLPVAGILGRLCYELIHAGSEPCYRGGEECPLRSVLESGEFRRVGGNSTLRCDVRIICATNRNLPSEVRRGNFREDLYYRLACLSINLPSLRARRDDIPELVEALLQRCRAPAQSGLRLTPEALELLQGYDFPGNVRELRNILQAAVAQARGTALGAGLIRKIMGSQPGPRGWGPAGRDGQEAAPAPAGSQAPPRDIERDPIEQLLLRFHGNRAAVAKALGVTERTVYRKLKRYGLR